jgi:hypothetical protein
MPSHPGRYFEELTQSPTWCTRWAIILHARFLSWLQNLNITMKLTASLFLLAASVVSASSTPFDKKAAANWLQKRASINDAANIGYATLNGG